MDFQITTNDLNTSNTNSIAIQLLNEKIKYLQEELANTQADKDFVWSLWRQLQCTNPDLTNSISLVLKREKEKSEKKDEKVLRILEVKDAKIDELMNIIASKTYEINEMHERAKQHDVEIKQKNEKLTYLNLNIKTFEDKVLVFEQVMRKQEENFDVDRKNFNYKVNQLINECKMYEENDLNFKNQKIFLENKLLSLENQLEQCDYELNSYKEGLDRVTHELRSRNEQFDRLSKKYNDVLLKNNTNVEYIRQQEQIIIQLKQIQNELQKTLKSQDETTSSHFTVLQEMYSEACKKLEENVVMQNQLRNDLNEKMTVIRQLERDLITDNKCELPAESVDKSNELILRHELKQVKLQNEILKQQLSDKNSIINDLNIEKTTKSMSAAKGRRKSVTIAAAATRKKRSLSLEDKKVDKRSSDSSESQTNPNLLLKKVDYYKNLYEAKNRELEIIESTHKRRMERVSYLEKQNQLLKQHLKSYMEEKQPLKESKNDGQKGDRVFSELSAYKHDNKHLLQEKLKLEEELDILKVNYEKQNTIINELNMELKYKMDEIKLDYELKFEEKVRRVEMLNNDLDEKCDLSQKLNLKVEKLAKTNSHLVEDRIRLSEMCSKLTEENNRLYKKYILIKKNETKQKILIEKMKRVNTEMKNTQELKRKVKKSKNTDEMAGESDHRDMAEEDEEEDEGLLEGEDDSDVEDEEETSRSSITDETDETVIENENQRSSPQRGFYTKKCISLLNNLKSYKKPEMSSKTKDSLLLSIKTLKRRLYHMTTKVKMLKDIEQRCKEVKTENSVLQNECLSLNEKLKAVRLANESITNEVASLKKRENELKEKFEKIKKEDKEADDDVKKMLESRIKTLSQDLNKQLALNKTLKSDTDKLTDKIRVFEEKQNHAERDNTQKKQLIEFYKKKLDDLKVDNEKLQQPTNENDELKAQIQKLTESNEKFKTQTQSLKTRLSVIQAEKQNYENKANENEKQCADISQKFEQLKKEKKQIEANLKESKTKVNELNTMVKEVEDDIEVKIKYLSENNEQALETIKMKLKEAYNLIFNYELILTKLYEILIKRNLSTREKLFQNQMILSKKKIEREQEEVNKIKSKSLNENLSKHGSLKQAMNLASTVLNLSSSELEDIMSSDSSCSTLQQHKQMDFNKQFKDFEDKMKVLYSNWIKQFEEVKRNDKVIRDYNANHMLELINEKLNDLIVVEKQLMIATTAA